MKNFIFIFFCGASILLEAQTNCILIISNTVSQSYTNHHAYCDENGKILYAEAQTPTINESIFPYKNGLGRIKRKGKFGFIDHKGEIKIPIIYDKAEDFNEGLAEVELSNRWGYINTKGELAIKAGFETVHRFSCGLAAFGEKGKHGYIDKNGIVAVAPIYDRVCHFRDNKAWVLSNGKWGCIDKKGAFIITPTYDDTFDFSEGYAWVKIGSLWGLIDSLNKFIIPPHERNNLIYAFSGTAKNFASVTNGLLISKANNKTGYCSIPSLQKTIPSKFDHAEEFKDSLAIVRNDGKFGIIDMKGNYVVEPLYKEIDRIGQKNIFAAKDKEKGWGLLNVASGAFTPLNCKKILYLDKIEQL